MIHKTLDAALLIIIILGSIVIVSLKLKPDYFRKNSDLGLNNAYLILQNNNQDEAKYITSSAEISLVKSKGDLIRVANISPKQLVLSPLVISGEARGFWYFEASFPIKIYDSNGKLLGSSIAQATSDWMTDKMVPFRAELKFNSATTTEGKIIFKKDNPSGLAENDDQLSLPITFMPVSEKTKIKVFFLNNAKDPEVSCNKVFPVDREIIKTPAIARASLEELLKGASLEESQEGFVSSINTDVKINSLSIDNGVAKVDFSEQLEKGVGGSCRVTAIRSQIVETLKQFNTINNVIISVNGRTEDILQP